MGRRSRARANERSAGERSHGDYTDEHGNVLTLRGSLTLGARREYARDARRRGSRAAATRRTPGSARVELLFERLAVRWTIAGAPVERPKELLARLRASAPAERAWVRDALREHCGEWFPDVSVP